MNRALGPEQLDDDMEPGLDIAAPKSAMAICAHPDDPDFFVSGTFAKWAASGTVCTYVVCTDGSKGAWEGDAATNLADVRRAEQRDAADIAGVESVVFLDREDGFLTNTLDLRRELVTVIRAHRPEIVVTHDPWRRWRLHPDHRECGFAACDAVVSARESLAWPDAGMRAHRPDRLWLFESEAPNRFEDIASTVELKISALLAHRSQWKTTLGIAADGDTAGRESFAGRITEWGRRQGRTAGLAVAEAFREMSV